MFFDNDLPMINFYSAAVFKSNAKTTSALNGSSFYRLNFYKNAGTVLVHGGKSITVRSKSIVFAAPDAQCTAHIFENESMISLLFYAMGESREKVCVLTPDNPKIYEELFDGILHTYSSKKIGYSYKCNELLNKILYMLSCEHSNAQSEKNCCLAKKAAKMIEKEISNSDFSMENLAENLNISTSYLRIIFRREYKISPKDYQINARMKLAKAILSDCRLPISDISAICGFDSERYFSAFFKKFYGVSPMQYKKSIRQI